jgi:hypothetical protein
MIKKSLCVVAILMMCFGLLNSLSVASTAPDAKLVDPMVGFIIGGQILNSEGRPIPRCIVTLTGMDGQVVSTAITNPFGYYRFFDVEAGATYSISVRAKGHQFMPQMIEVTGDDLNINFTSQE